jgi:acyl carrier protein
MSTEVDDRVREIVADLFGLPSHEVTADSSPEVIEKWDSLQHLNLVLDLERSFQLKFPPAEIERMKTVGEICRLINTKLYGESTGSSNVNFGDR